MIKAQIIIAIISTAFMFYGGYRFVKDYLSHPISVAAAYIDGMGAAFWVCLVAAGILVIIANAAKKR